MPGLPAETRGPVLQGAGACLPQGRADLRRGRSSMGARAGWLASERAFYEKLPHNGGFVREKRPPALSPWAFSEADSIPGWTLGPSKPQWWGEDRWRRLAPLPQKLVRMCISVLAPKEPGGGGMGRPETAEPRDGRGLIRGISTADRAHMEVAGSTRVGDPGLLHWFHAPHSAHQEGWLGTCVPAWSFTLLSILHPGLSAGILRGDSGGDGQVALSTSPPRSSPVKQWLLPTVKGILQVPHQVGLAGHTEEALLGEPTLPDEVHTLLHQQRRQAWARLPLVVDCVLQALPKDPWAQRGAGHTLS